MAFFQNPFFEEFKGTWPLGDRSFIRPFTAKGNTGRGFDIIKAWNKSDIILRTYDLSGNDSNGDIKNNLTIRFAYRDFTKFFALTIDVSGLVVAQTTPTEIVAALNTNNLFSTHFVASLGFFSGDDVARQVVITSKKPSQVKFFIVNSGAEEVLNFNKKAGVADLPLYFSRHTVDNLLNFTDCTGSLIQLSHTITEITLASPAVVTSIAHGLKDGDIIDVVRTDSNAVIDGPNLTVDITSANDFKCGQNVATAAGATGFWAKVIDSHIIENAVDPKEKSLGFSLATGLFDWELLHGQSGIYMSRNNIVDANGGNPRITQIIEYPTGSQAGNLGRKITYTYTNTQVVPDTIAEIPYVLTDDDLITP